VLLLLLGAEGKSEGRIPLKVFEYLAANRPIICIGSKSGDVAKIVEEANAGKVVDFHDKVELSRVIGEYYQQYKTGNLIIENQGLKKFSRKNLSSQLSEVLNKLISN
jgi:glycosyltransferase involved in cell wall biosynthesis